MENVHLNFSRICRTCKGESTNMRSLFQERENSGQKTRVDEMLMACASVQIDSEDLLPKLICEPCIEKLESAYTFKKQCETIDLQFQTIIRTIKDNSIKEELQISQAEEVILNDILTLEIVASAPEQEIKTNPKNDVFPLTVDNTFVPEVIMQEHTANSDYIEFVGNGQLLLHCRICLKMFTTLDGLKCHKRVHTGDLFKCKTCDKEYIRLNHLQRHELSHGKRKIHMCKICNKTLNRFEHLKRHLITHLKEKPFACMNCNRGFNRMEHLLNHVKRCKGEKVYICDICSKAFNREDSLEVHKRVHENKMPVLPTLDNLDNIEEHYYEIDCDDTTFPPYPDSDEDEAEGDVEDDEFQPFGEHVEKEIIVRDGGTENIEEDIGCEGVNEICNEDTSGQEDFLQDSDHMRVGGIEEEDEQKDCGLIETKEVNLSLIAKLEDGSVEDVSEVYDETYEENLGFDSDSGQSDYVPSKTEVKVKRGRGRPRKNLSNMKKQKNPGKRGRPKLKKEKVESEDDVEEGEFTCPTCNKIFKKPSLLEKHREKCGDETKVYKCEDFSCNICQQPFARGDHLQKHKLLKHKIGEKMLGEKKFQCNMCMKSFTTEKYRDVHMKGHMGEKKFQCKTCEKCFLSKSHLTEHMKFHNDNSKKFLCSECGQRFIRNDYLVIHMRRHRGEKPFKCKYCGKGFPRTTDLTVHERYHTGEKTHLCTICGRGFGRAYNLTVHMRTHTGEKPYQCTYCDAAFAQGNDLKAHIRRHTGERFHCDLCPDSFLMGYLLTQHKRTVHGLNIVSNIRRLQPVMKQQQNPDDPPPLWVPLPEPVVPASILNSQIQAHLDSSVTVKEQMVTPD